MWQAIAEYSQSRLSYVIDLPPGDDSLTNGDGNGGGGETNGGGSGLAQDDLQWLTYAWCPVYVDAIIARDRDADRNTSTSAYGGSVSGNVIGAEERLYVQTDANYNVTSLADATTGALVERFVMDPYGGNVITLDGSTWAPETEAYDWKHFFQGGRHSTLIDKVDFRHRFDSPNLMRWVQQDPAGYVDGPSLYASAKSSPVNNVDPLGLQSTPFLPDPSRRPPGYNPNWPTGVDNRAPFVEDPASGTKWYPHPADNGHWDHYDSDKGDRFPRNSVKPRPGQKKPKLPHQSAVDPWPTVPTVPAPAPSPAPSPAPTPTPAPAPAPPPKMNWEWELIKALDRLSRIMLS